MILVDANLPIHASYVESRQHKATKEWLEQCFNGDTRVGLPWESLVAYVRIITNPRMFERPLDVVEALRQVEDWLELPTVWTPGPTKRHAALFTAFSKQVGIGGNIVQDAHLAALAVEHGLTLCSTDTDFARFKDLVWYNPIE